MGSPHPLLTQLAPGIETTEEEYNFPFSTSTFISSSLNLAQSTPSTVKIVLDLLQANAPKMITSPKFLDLGCGDGRYVFEAARRGLYAVGVDIEPTNIAICEELAKEYGLSDLCQFYLDDFFKFDLSSYNLISCYLYDKTMFMIAKRLKERLQTGNCLVATVLYQPPNWIPLLVDHVYKVHLFDGNTVWQ